MSSFPAIAVGDFNGDGKLDLAVAGRSISGTSGTLTILFGDGAGGFIPAPGSPLTLPSIPASLAAGDFNGDGKLDIALANGANNSLSLLLGDGAGGFNPAPGGSLGAGSAPISIVVGDFNDDGKADIALANTHGNNVSVLLGDGLGGFGSAAGSPFAVGVSPLVLLTGDFNADGKLDIATANGDGTVSILLGDGKGGFRSASTIVAGSGPVAVSLAAADLNRDGMLDLVVGLGTGGVAVLLGNGSGGFSAAPGSPLVTTLLPYSVGVGDFNGDKKEDIFVAQRNGATIVLLGDGSGGFTPDPGPSPYGGPSPATLVVADFNGDGKLDVAIGDLGSQLTVLLDNYPSLGFPCTNTVPPRITSINSAGDWGGYSYFTSGTWLEIKGVNLADPIDPRLKASVNPGQWTAADFAGVNAPMVLDGVGVTVNGKPGFVWYISPVQINVQAPEDTVLGDVPVTVTNCKATSAPMTLTKKAQAGGFLAPAAYSAHGTQYMVATFASDGAYVLDSALGASFGLKSRPAKPGDLIVAYGTGFGDVTPSILPGVIAGQSNTLVNGISVAFGTTKATVLYAGLAPGTVGLYQFDIVVPSTLANGDYQINVIQNGGAVPQTMYLTVSDN